MIPINLFEAGGAYHDTAAGHDGPKEVDLYSIFLSIREKPGSWSRQAIG